MRWYPPIHPPLPYHRIIDVLQMYRNTRVELILCVCTHSAFIRIYLRYRLSLLYSIEEAPKKTHTQMYASISSSVEHSIPLHRRTTCAHWSMGSGYVCKCIWSMLILPVNAAKLIGRTIEQTPVKSFILFFASKTKTKKKRILIAETLNATA